MSETLVLRLAVGLFVKASVVLLTAYGLTLALRRHSAAARHAVWTAAVGVLLVVPIAANVLPRWDLARPASEAPAAPVLPAVPVAPDASAVTAPAPETDLATAPVPDLRDPRRDPWRSARLTALLVWLAGVTLGLGLLGRDLLRVRALRRRAWPAGRSDRATWFANAIRRALGIERPVAVGYTPDLGVPAASGLVRPIILLPDAARRWSADRLRVVLLHELAHVARKDYLSHLLTQVTRALYWPNPLVWIATRRAALEQERACDDTVLRAGARSDTYAEHLVAVARGLRSRPPVTALAMAQPGALARRVRAILRRDADRSELARRALLGTAIGAALVALPVGTVRLLGEARSARAERLAVRALEHPDADTRTAAAWLLGNAGAERAVPALLARLADSVPQARAVAAWALGEIGDRDAVPPLRDRLADPDAYVREAAILALSRMGAHAAVGDFAALAGDSVMGVRGVLTVGMRRLGGEEASRTLARLALHDADPHVRGMAMGNLAEMDRARARRVLVTLLDDPDPAIRVQAASLMPALATPAEIPALVRVATDDEDAQARGVAVSALGATRSPAAIPALRRAQTDSVYHVRVRANYALGRIGGPDAAQALLTALRDPVHQVRLSAFESLEDLRGP
jgi:HEAT repeat protein/beta-lactamase regulating signal transducer with metallopeptidase domain